jgi:NADH-quinone oxidoreductase subunit M
VAPWLSDVFMVTTLASVGLPMLNNFVGEFLVLQGAAGELQLGRLRRHRRDSLRVYMLWLVQRTFYGETPEPVRKHVPT